MDDNMIIEAFWERRENVLGEVSAKYSKLYRGVLREILVDTEDIEECANDLLLALWNSIPPNRPDNLAGYICVLARRIGINRYRHNTRIKRGGGYTLLLSELEDSIPDQSEAYEEDGEKIAQVLSDFVKEMDAQSRVLFVRRYLFCESTTSLSKRFDLSENTVAVKLFRIRKRLKEKLRKEGIFL